MYRYMYLIDINEQIHIANVTQKEVYLFILCLPSEIIPVVMYFSQVTTWTRDTNEHNHISPRFIY